MQSPLQMSLLDGLCIEGEQSAHIWAFTPDVLPCKKAKLLLVARWRRASCTSW